MATPPPTISRFVSEILRRRESFRFETKRVSGKMVQKALETICAFSNTEGGLLILGVEDADKAEGQDRLYGLSENLEAVAELRRKINSHFRPAIVEPDFYRLPICNRDGLQDEVAIVRILPGTKVHSIVDDGTWLRIENSNREMTAAEITRLSYRRGVVSAETELVEINIDLLDTQKFREYCEERGLSRGTLEKRLERIGLARQDNGGCFPTKAAVLLFADSPSDLLALGGARAGIRIFHYSGSAIDRSEHPNLRKPPKTINAPVYDLILETTEYVMGEISEGFEMSSGFKAKHTYPKRVVKEAITNAILHRDYRYQKDVHIRIFDDRIEVESPGQFPANITPSTIEKAGSSPRNPSLVNHLREFPSPPNVDAGEGVPMMFSEMKAGGFYPPRFSENESLAIPSVTIRLLNETRPAVWEQVSAFIDKHGPIANRDLREIANLETLQATRMLKGWVEKGLLTMHGSGKKNTSYRKPSAEEAECDLLSFGEKIFTEGSGHETLDDNSQSAKFARAAKELGCDEDDDAVDELMKRVASSPPPRKDEKSKPRKPRK